MKNQAQIVWQNYTQRNCILFKYLLCKFERKIITFFVIHN